LGADRYLHGRKQECAGDTARGRGGDP
jgi:hypothetical protein